MDDVKVPTVRDCVCPVCQGEPVDRFCVCDGRGLLDRATAQECAAMMGDGCEVRQLPAPPERMRAPCDDCAYRGDSPEQERPEVVATLRRADRPFYCHQGMYLTPKGRYVPLAEDAAGEPVGHPLCAGWVRAAARNARLAMRARVAADLGATTEPPPSQEELAALGLDDASLDEAWDRAVADLDALPGGSAPILAGASSALEAWHDAPPMALRVVAGPDQSPTPAPMFHEFDDTPFRVAADWTPPPRVAGEAVRPPAFANERGWKPARAHVSGKRVFYAPSPTPGRWWRMTANTAEEAERSATSGKPHDLPWAYLQSIIRPETDAEALEP